MLNDTGDALQRVAERFRIGNALGVGVNDVIAAIGDDRLIGFAADAQHDFIARTFGGAQRFSDALLRLGLHDADLRFLRGDILLGFDALIDARHADLEAAPLTNWTAVESYVDATAGGVMRLALSVCGVRLDEAFVAQAARVWGLLGLLRARGAMAMHGHALLPREATLDDALARVSDAHAAARATLPLIPAEAFPACGYVSLAPAYAKALKQGRNRTPLLFRQFQLIAASATGRY